MFGQINQLLTCGQLFPHKLLDVIYNAHFLAPFGNRHLAIHFDFWLLFELKSTSKEDFSMWNSSLFRIRENFLSNGKGLEKKKEESIVIKSKIQTARD